MTKDKVKRAAEARGIRFDVKKKWLNSQIGYGYEFYTPNGCGFRQADTLEGIYRAVMEYPKIKEAK